MAMMAAAAVKGFQGDDLTDPERVLACAKHFIGYGAVEGGRDYNSTEVTATTLPCSLCARLPEKLQTVAVSRVPKSTRQ